jgi:hypothetical protein
MAHAGDVNARLDPSSIETFHGMIESTSDAFRVFDLCRRGRLGRIRRRLHDKERRLIRSGSVFCFDEAESGIKRWTDGRLWSPSRILGNFLIYRELGRKVTALQQKSTNSSNTGVMMPNYQSHSHSRTVGGDRAGGAVKTPTTVGDTTELLLMGDLSWLNQSLMSEPSQSVSADEALPSYSSDASNSNAPNSSMSSLSSLAIDPMIESVRRLEASWRTLATAGQPTTNVISNGNGAARSSLARVASPLLYATTNATSHNNALHYQLKSDGLIKKTISAKVDGRLQHLVCYYSKRDFCDPGGGPLRHLPQMLELRQWPVPLDLMLHQNFRKPPLSDDPTIIKGGGLVGENRRKRRHSHPTTHPHLLHGLSQSNSKENATQMSGPVLEAASLMPRLVEDDAVNMDRDNDGGEDDGREGRVRIGLINGGDDRVLLGSSTQGGVLLSAITENLVAFNANDMVGNVRSRTNGDLLGVDEEEAFQQILLTSDPDLLANLAFLDDPPNG